MKKTDLLLSVVAAISLTMLIAFFFWKLHSNAQLKQQLETKSRELKEARSRLRLLEQLEQRQQEWLQKEESLNKMVPRGEKQPLSLIKTLIGIGGEIGLKNAVFNIGGTKNQANLLPGQTSGSANLQGALPENLSGYQSGQTQMPAADQGSTGLEPLPIPIEIEVSFEATYLQALDFLKKAAGIERVVAVEGITIERKKEILPYQKISLQLVAYAFAQQ